MYDECVFSISVKKWKRDGILRKSMSQQIKIDLVAIT